MFGNPGAQDQLTTAADAVAGGRCDEHCAWLLTHAVTVEVCRQVPLPLLCQQLATCLPREALPYPR